jgi:hypothetical protein
MAPVKTSRFNRKLLCSACLGGIFFDRTCQIKAQMLYTEVNGVGHLRLFLYNEGVNGLAWPCFDYYIRHKNCRRHSCSLFYLLSDICCSLARQ